MLIQNNRQTIVLYILILAFLDSKQREGKQQFQAFTKFNLLFISVCMLALFPIAYSLCFIRQIIYMTH